jgi:acetyltransferase-like isoleucine patch superfamily enzyme
MIARSLLIALLPQSLKRVALCRMFGWSVDPSARVGLSFFDNVRHVRLGPRASIGHFNVFRDLVQLDVEADAAIGQWNWITAADVLVRGRSDGGEGGTLRLGSHSAITSRHYVDCSGGVVIGDHTTVAGVRSTILTHEIDVATSRQTVAGVRIGDFCFVGSNARVTPGSFIPDRCVTAMGAVVAGALPEPGALYGGVPARVLRDVGDGEYFRRERGHVD